MKKEIYAVIAAGILATGAAQAVTVDDLVQYGGDAIEIFYGNYKQRTLHDYVNGYVHFEKVNDSTVVLKNYYGLCDVPFILKDNKLVMAYTEDDDNPTNTLEVESSKYAFIHITPQVAINQVYYSKNGLRYTSDIITEKNGEYQINFNKPVKIEAYNGSDGNYTLVGREWKNIYSVVVFKPNASITDYDVKAQKARSYKGKVTFNDDNTFTFINFGAKGYGIENYQSGNMIYSRLKKLTGGFDRDSAEVWMDYQQITSNIGALSDNGYGTVYSYKLCRVDTAVTPYDFYQPLNGPVTFTGAHHTGASAWVTDGGDRRTLETVNMEFRPWSAFNVNLNSNSGQPFVTDTRVTVPDHDVTLDVAFTSVDAATSADNANLNVDAAWKAAKNEWYVASYDLMMVPGKYTAAADVPLDKAVTLAAGVAKSATGCEAQGSVEAPVVESATTVDYTLFIKANYDAATGLTATLHNLYPVQFNVGVPTGVSSVEAAKEVKSVVYYNAAGVALSEPATGLNIKVVTYTDGTTATSKLIK